MKTFATKSNGLPFYLTPSQNRRKLIIKFSLESFQFTLRVTNFRNSFFFFLLKWFWDWNWSDENVWVMNFSICFWWVRCNCLNSNVLSSLNFNKSRHFAIAINVQLWNIYQYMFDSCLVRPQIHRVLFCIFYVPNSHQNLHKVQQPSKFVAIYSTINAKFVNIHRMRMHWLKLLIGQKSVHELNSIVYTHLVWVYGSTKTIQKLIKCELIENDFRVHKKIMIDNRKYCFSHIVFDSMRLSDDNQEPKTMKTIRKIFHRKII